jgi:hypothetical protein
VTAINGILVAISISDAPDRARLGFPQREIDRALLSLCTALVRAGAEIAYGGNLDPSGYTFKIFRHLSGAYAGSRGTPFHHFLPEPVLRITRYDNLLAALREGSGIVRTEIARGDEFVPARPSGGGIRLGDEVVVDDAGLVAWLNHAPHQDSASAHTAARRMVTARAGARVVLGGKMGVLEDPRDAYQGAMPGVAEEAIMTLEEQKPLIALGAFGGAARDIAIALGLLTPDAMVPRSAQHTSYAAAMARVEALRDRIPDQLRDNLTKVADNDQAEQTAFQVMTLINEWLRIRSVT